MSSSLKFRVSRKKLENGRTRCLKRQKKPVSGGKKPKKKKKRVVRREGSHRSEICILGRGRGGTGNWGSWKKQQGKRGWRGRVFKKANRKGKERDSARILLR